MPDCFWLRVLFLMVCDEVLRFPKTRSSRCNLVCRKVYGVVNESGAGVGRVGQLNLCVETIRYFEGINLGPRAGRLSIGKLYAKEYVIKSEKTVLRQERLVLIETAGTVTKWSAIRVPCKSRREEKR